jgi:LPS-assembly protein
MSTRRRAAWSWSRATLALLAVAATLAAPATAWQTVDDPPPDVAAQPVAAPIPDAATAPGVAGLPAATLPDAALDNVGEAEAETPPEAIPNPGENAAPTDTPPAAVPEGPRITFTLPFPEDQGGGEASGSAGALDYEREDYAILSGGVRLRYQDTDLRAEEVSIDLTTKQLTALGNVVIDQGPNRLTGSSATYDLDTRTGELRQASASAPQGVYFTGDRIEKVGESEFVVEKGIFTSCSGEVPAWSFHLGHARIQLEDYAFVRNTSMRVKSVPVFYLPYMVWPTKTERASGFLVPKIGSSNDRGAYVGMAYYQLLGQSADATMFADLYSKDYLGVGTEVRYHPTEDTRGRVRGWAVDDGIEDDWRWKIRWDHDTRDLPWDLRAVVQYENYSDFEFFRDFERSYEQKAKSSIYSTAFLTRNDGPHSLNFLVDRRQNFLGGFTEEDVIELRQLPELEYRLRPTRLGKLPLYLSLDGAAHYLGVDRPGGLVEGEYGRFNLAPQLRMPLSPAPWLSLTLTAGERFTWWGDSLGPVGPAGESGFRGESLSRSVPTAGLEAIGPSISRIFDVEVGPFGKLKHVVEPRVEWGYADTYDEQENVAIFDEIDPAGGSNLGRVALINRLLGKPKDEKEGGSREIASIEVSRRYSFDDEVPLEGNLIEGDVWGPVEMTLRAYPTQSFGLRLDADYSMLFGQLTGIRTSGNFKLGRQRFDFTWAPRWEDSTGDVVTNQGSLGWRLQAGKEGRLTLSSLFGYDFDRSFLRDQRHFITWAGSCYALRLELHESTTIDATRRDYLFSIDLKNVGTFIDLTGGDDQEF